MPVTCSPSGPESTADEVGRGEDSFVHVAIDAPLEERLSQKGAKQRLDRRSAHAQQRRLLGLNGAHLPAREVVLFEDVQRAKPTGLEVLGGSATTVVEHDVIGVRGPKRARHRDR